MKKKTCAQVAKEYVDEMNSRGQSSNIAEWLKACSDFPKEPEVIKKYFDYTGNTSWAVHVPEDLKGKKWRGVFTEIIE